MQDEPHPDWICSAKRCARAGHTLLASGLRGSSHCALLCRLLCHVAQEMEAHAKAAADFLWPPDLERLVYSKLPVRRSSAARIIQRRVLTHFTRRWFLQYQRHAVLWPAAVCLAVCWSALHDAIPGSAILGIHVRPASVWHKILMVAYYLNSVNVKIKKLGLRPIATRKPKGRVTCTRPILEKKVGGVWGGWPPQEKPAA